MKNGLVRKLAKGMTIALSAGTFAFAGPCTFFADFSGILGVCAPDVIDCEDLLVNGQCAEDEPDCEDTLVVEP